MRREVRLYGWAPWPRTEFDAEKQEFRIGGLFTPPGAYETQGYLYVFSVIGLLITAGQMGGEHAPAVVIGVFVAAVLAYKPLWEPAMQRLFGGKVDVRISKDGIAVLRRGEKLRLIPRDFGVEILREPHQKAQLMAHGVPVWNGGAYKTAMEVVIRYMDFRVVVAPMLAKDHEKSMALTVRLQAVVNDFEKLAAHFGGGPAKADEEPDVMR